MNRHIRFVLGLALVALVPLAAEAGFTSVEHISSNKKQTLSDGTIYIIDDDDVSVKAGSGQSAYKVNVNATAVLYIPAGKTLTLKGGVGSGMSGAGAGLEVPPSATLIVTGEGTLVATGGQGANGSAGGGGEDANVDGSGKPHDDWGRAGLGGRGGDGGGGAGAGIGGKGGSGGNGRDEPRKASNWHDTNGDWECRGYNGYSGNSGSKGDGCGTIYVLGSVQVTAAGGASGASGGGSGNNGSKDKEYWTLSYRAGGGGGGGGGGSGGAANAIGGGGGGGGAGGGGGEGSRYRTTQGYTYRSANGGHGGGGSGGSSGGVSGSGSRTDGEDGWFVGTGGDGGSGGSGGAVGANGTVYKSAAASVSGASSTTAAETHSAIEYTITFDDGWRLNSTASVKFGFPLPQGPVTSRYGYTFKGWYKGANGSGTQYYDENGNSKVPLWSDAGDVTLYPKWEVYEHESLTEVSLKINGTDIVEGTDASGDGWSYSSASGRIAITGANRVYDISGKDLHGFAQIVVTAANCTLQVTRTLDMKPDRREGYNPITIQSGASATLSVSTAESVDASCSLDGASGRTAISVAPGATLTLKATGALNVTGGDGAADIGLDKDAASCGNIYVETYGNWFANIRPGHGLSDDNGLLNNLGKGANFISATTGERIWSVRMPDIPDGTMYLQRIEGDIHDSVHPNSDGNAWFWMPVGGFEWAERLNASLTDGDALWICYVDSQHSSAEVFYPLHIEIDGEDIAHLNGNGWYATLTGSSGGVVEGTKATLVITNAGPHVVTGYGNAGIDIMCDMALTISNLTLNTSSWSGKAAMWIRDGATVDLTVEGDNRLTSGSDCPGLAAYAGRTLNIDGSGSLRAQGGKNAAGIGGSPVSRQSGTINISGGTITASGGANAAGIGGAQGVGQSGDITISGGVVTARGGQYAAAVGGGYKGCANVCITGGTVFPTSGSRANAIGSGYSAGSVSTKNEFGLAAIYTTSDGVSPSAKNSAGAAVFPVTFDLGPAYCQVTNIVIKQGENTAEKPCVDLWTNEGGNLVLWLESSGENMSTITITGVDENGTETKKSWGYKIDDSGHYEFSRDIVTVDGEPIVGGVPAGGSGTGWVYDDSSGILLFTSGSHTVSGNSTNGTIRIVVKGSDNVNLELDKLTLKTSAEGLSPFIVSNKCTMTLTGDNVIECIYNPNGRSRLEKGSQYTAAVEVPKGASLTIEGEGTLTANGGFSGAGIGSRGSGFQSAGSITIKSGYVYATGGDGSSGGGAGIGGGLGGGVASILITGGYVQATGGNGANGIGGGWGKGIYLTNGTVRVTGGTVLAEGGAGASYGLVTSPGNTMDVTIGKSIVIDGPCSVRSKSGNSEDASYLNPNPYPNPVNSNDVRLVFAMIDGVGEGDIVQLVDPLWPQYYGVDILADDDGVVCLWGEYTNVVRSIQIESPNIPGGMMTFEVSASSNTVYHATEDYEAPDSRKVDGKDCWRVAVHALPAKKRLVVEGIDRKYSRGTTVSDVTGMTYLYLPDGEYDFSVGGYAYHASVSGAPTTATFTTGLYVNGVDIAEGEGEGWTYNGTEETLKLAMAGEYVISGTNAERRVSVSVEVSKVKIRADRLKLMPADKGAFYTARNDMSFEFVGGTVSTGDIPARMIVSGGSIEATVKEPVARIGANSYTNAYCVTIGGLTRYAAVDVINIDGLENYDTQGIYANEYGDVHLYLPDGDYYFKVVDGVSTNEMIAIVENEDVMALNYTPTGVYINGRDAARLRGKDDAGNTLWRNEDGLVDFLVSTNYVISGTNDGSEVTLRAEESWTTLVLDNLVMTNALMDASPISLGNGQRAQFTIELVGTNILHGVAPGTCGVEIREMAQLEFIGDGRLEAQGAGSGIGTGPEGVPDGASVTVSSGEIVALGGNNAAGIGGGPSQAGIATYIYGGTVAATGGAGGAGIGGGDGGSGATVTVTNGVVNATGGDGGAGIGGGLRGASGNYRQTGGTVVVSGSNGGADIGIGHDGGEDTSKSNVITGGSLKSSSAKVSPSAKNASGDKVYCVTVPTGRPNFDIGAVTGDFHGYSLVGAVTDDEGKIYIWLPNGKYYINIGHTPFRAIVNDADAMAETWSVGVEVNGEDVALQSGGGWTYTVDTGVLSVFGDGCTISGTNTMGEACLLFTNNVSAVVSNLCLTTAASSTESPLSVASNAAVTLALAGENSFTSGAENYAGVNVPYGSSLSITNLDSVVLVPDLDGIQVVTNNVLYDIEYDGDGNPKIDPNTGCVITNGIIYDVQTITNYNSTVVQPRLTAVGANYGAGIGGGNLQSHGTITILGGVIDASGGSYCAAIGGGRFPDSGDGFADAETLRQGTILIYGGEVTANGGEFAAGIGGGNRHSGGVIRIFGGKVAATGGTQAAGIGGGWGARGHTISISGGEVTANGSFYAAAIGGSSESHLSVANTEMCQIAISGGRVTAITQGEGGAGIGSGRYDNENAAVNITGGTVVTTAGNGMHGYSTPDDIGIGACADTNFKLHPLTIKGASVHVTHRTAGAEYVSPAPSNGTERVYCVTVQTESTNELAKVQYLDGYSDDSQIYGDENGKVYLWLPNGTYVFYAGGLPFRATVNGADTTATEWLTGVTADGVDVSFAGADGKKWAYDFGTKTLYVNGDCVISGMNTAGYVNILAGLVEEDEGGNTGTVECSFTISNLHLKATSRSKSSPITVKEGTVTICLAGANRLDATETDSFAGLNVVSPATLVITNLEENARLEAYSGEDAAAIGGNQNKEDGVNYTTGTICIRGGIIYAQAKDSGAGIGSGYRGRSGSISISGGRVEAHGGEYPSIAGTWCGAGIGGGDNATVSAECKIAISGGTVEAYGGIRNDSKYAADIGAGYDGNSVYRIEITGGSVHPEADDESRYFNQSERSTDVIPRNRDEYRVYKVTLDGFTPNSKVDFDMSGYGSNDIWADSAGKIYLWLADGTYVYKAGGVRYAMKANQGAVTKVEMPDAYGVLVDGVDVAELSGSAWTYDPFTDILSLTGDCTVAGTNTYAAIKVKAVNNVTVSPDRLMIGAGSLSGELLSGSGTVTITNGTAYLTGGVTCPVVIRGGSLKHDSNTPASFSNGTEPVHRVMVEDLKPMSPIAFAGLPGYYGTSNIYADYDGRVYLWLPNGTYVFAATDEDDSVREYIVAIADADAVASTLVHAGFTVNGCDIAYLNGEGWSYRNDTVTISGTGHYELTGALTNKFLNIESACSIALSNVVFNSFNVYGRNGIVNIAGAFDVEMTLFGSNVVKTTIDKIAGIAVPEGAALVIDGVGSLTAIGGNYGAGIGGRFDVGCGSITVNGGTVTATGGKQSAGIGGGSFTGGTSVDGTYGGDITINGGTVTATGGDWAAGIGGGEQSSGGSVKVTGGKITAEGGVWGPAIGACGGAGTYGGVTISGGTVVAVTNELTRGIGSGRDTVSAGGVKITGGSVDVADFNVNPAPSNGTERVWRVEVTNLTAGAAVVFDGLPDYYSTTNIYADAAGKVYLWLPENWETAHSVTPRLLTAAPRRLGAPSGTEYTFAANGYSYTVTIPEGGGEVVAKKGEALQLNGLKIDGFAVKDGQLVINLTVNPATWLQGFADRLVIRASETLPIPKDALLDLSGAELLLEDTTHAVFTVPLDAEAQSMFFSVGLDENGK